MRRAGRRRGRRATDAPRRIPPRGSPRFPAAPTTPSPRTRGEAHRRVASATRATPGREEAAPAPDPAAAASSRHRRSSSAKTPRRAAHALHLQALREHRANLGDVHALPDLRARGERRGSNARGEAKLRGERLGKRQDVRVVVLRSRRVYIPLLLRKKPPRGGGAPRARRRARRRRTRKTSRRARAPSAARGTRARTNPPSDRTAPCASSPSRRRSARVPRRSAASPSHRCAADGEKPERRLRDVRLGAHRPRIAQRLARQLGARGERRGRGDGGVQALVPRQRAQLVRGGDARRDARGGPAQHPDQVSDVRGGNTPARARGNLRGRRVRVGVMRRETLAALRRAPQHRPKRIDERSLRLVERLPRRGHRRASRSAPTKRARPSAASLLRRADSWNSSPRRSGSSGVHASLGAERTAAAAAWLAAGPAASSSRSHSSHGSHGRSAADAARRRLESPQTNPPTRSLLGGALIAARHRAGVRARARVSIAAGDDLPRDQIAHHHPRAARATAPDAAACASAECSSTSPPGQAGAYAPPPRGGFHAVAAAVAAPAPRRRRRGNARRPRAPSRAAPSRRSLERHRDEARREFSASSSPMKSSPPESRRRQPRRVPRARAPPPSPRRSRAATAAFNAASARTAAWTRVARRRAPSTSRARGTVAARPEPRPPRARRSPPRGDGPASLERRRVGGERHRRGTRRAHHHRRHAERSEKRGALRGRKRVVHAVDGGGDGGAGERVGDAHEVRAETSRRRRRVGRAAVLLLVKSRARGSLPRIHVAQLQQRKRLAQNEQSVPGDVAGHREHRNHRRRDEVRGGEGRERARSAENRRPRSRPRPPAALPLARARRRRSAGFDARTRRPPGAPPAPLSADANAPSASSAAARTRPGETTSPPLAASVPEPRDRGGGEPADAARERDGGVARRLGRWSSACGGKSARTPSSVPSAPPREGSARRRTSARRPPRTRAARPRARGGHAREPQRPRHRRRRLLRARVKADAAARSPTEIERAIAATASASLASGPRPSCWRRRRQYVAARHPGSVAAPAPGARPPSPDAGASSSSSSSSAALEPRARRARGRGRGEFGGVSPRSRTPLARDRSPRGDPRTRRLEPRRPPYDEAFETALADAAVFGRRCALWPPRALGGGAGLRRRRGTPRTR